MAPKQKPKTIERRQKQLLTVIEIPSHLTPGQLRKNMPDILNTITKHAYLLFNAIDAQYPPPLPKEDDHAEE